MNESDQHIIQKVLQGEQRAYAELVDRHKNKAMTLAVRMLRDRHEAEEALQDAFVRAYRALPSFQGKSSFGTWFYRIVYNVCSTVLSKRGKEYFVSIDEHEEGMLNLEIPSDDETPDVQIESREFRSMIKFEIEKMEQQYAEILTLFYLQDFGYEEIMEVTGLPLGTVKNRLFRARTILRNAVLKRSEVTNEAA
jgi:RNA polymerase sigma-70 factor, ECF subfamily